MTKAKLIVTLDENLLSEVDRLVRRRAFPNRSLLIEEAVQEKLDRLAHKCLAQESAKLDPFFEKAMAEEGIGEKADQWPESWDTLFGSLKKFSRDFMPERVQPEQDKRRDRSS